MILDKMGLPIVHLFSSGSLIPPKVQFWGSDGSKTSKLMLSFLPYKDNHHSETKLYFYVFVSVKCEMLVVEGHRSKSLNLSYRNMSTQTMWKWQSLMRSHYSFMSISNKLTPKLSPRSLIFSIFLITYDITSYFGFDSIDFRVRNAFKT